jgi:hypothetical protein
MEHTLSVACEAILKFQAARDFRFEPVSHSYMRMDSMRYAPGLAYGSDPLAPEQLDFVYERSRVFPPILSPAALRLSEE